VLTQKLAGEPLKRDRNKIQGIGAGFIPEVLDLALVDAVEKRSLTKMQSTTHTRPHARRGHFVRHFSCGAAAAVAARIARRPENANKTIVVILPELRRALPEFRLV